MQNCPKKSPLLAGIIAVAVLGYGVYYFSHKTSPEVEAKPVENKEAIEQSEKPTSKISSSFTAQQQQEIQNIFLELIREKPELFMGAMNEGMQAQQDKLRVEMEKNATDMKDKLISAGISLGVPQAEVHMIAFIDPMCPHCHEFYKVANALLQKRQDIVIHMIPIAILGPNSVAMSKILLAVAKQSPDKMNVFFNKFINKTTDIDRAKLLQMAKDSGIDIVKMEKDELADETEKTLIAHTQLAEQLKIPGVPTIFGVQKDGKVVIIPPMDLDGFNKTIDSLKGVETPVATPATETTTAPVSTTETSAPAAKPATESTPAKDEKVKAF